MNKKETVMAMEILLNLIKKTLKNRDEVFCPALGLSALSKEKPGLAEIPRLVRQ
jgi:hypothetical protein